MKQNSEFDPSNLEGFLQEILRRIKSEADPAELNRVRQTFKKQVPLFMRSYVAAYLLRYGSTRPPRQRPESSSTLFVSIGKNRRVFPRDLVQFLITAGSLQKHEIGDIKILDNYSFVEVEESKAGGVISLLDGTNFRGRRITVNFAKKREERDSRDEKPQAASEEFPEDPAEDWEDSVSDEPAPEEKV